MTQHTHNVQQKQQQQSQSQSQQQQQQQQSSSTSTTQINNNNNNNNNNGNNTNNNQSTTLGIQQQQPGQAQNNNVVATQSYVTSTMSSAVAPPAGQPIYNQPNIYIPANGVPQSVGGAAMYPAMIPAAIPSNVYVHNVTANVNLHGWAHTMPAYIAGNGHHFIHGEIPADQNSLMQPIPAMQPVALAPANAITGGSSGGNNNTGGRGPRRVRGRGGSSGSRRNDYNSQRHPPPEGSPAPQQQPQSQEQIQQSMGQQQPPQQQLEAQFMGGVQPAYAAHPQYGGPSAYPYAYFPPNHMIHPAQAAAQQATGSPFYVPIYPGHQLYNYPGSFIYPPMMNPGEYQFVPGDDVQGDDRQNPEGMIPQIWHPQHLYTEEYAMNPEIHGGAGGDDINQNASSMGSSETPSMLSPNYQIYDPQIHEIQQQMGVMQIYDEPQIGPMPGMHPGGALPQLEDEMSDCGAPAGAIQLVPAGAMLTPIHMQPDPQIVHHHHGHPQQPPPHHLMAGPMMAIEPHQQVQQIGEHVIIDGYSNDITALQSSESISNLSEVNQQSCESIAQEYHHSEEVQQQQQQAPSVASTYSNSNSNNVSGSSNDLMPDVNDAQPNVPNVEITSQPAPVAAIVQQQQPQSQQPDLPPQQPQPHQQQHQQQQQQTPVAATHQQQYQQQQHHHSHQQQQHPEPEQYESDEKQQQQQQQHHQQQQQGQPQPHYQSQQHQHQHQQQYQGQHQQQPQYYQKHQRSFNSQHDQQQRKQPQHHYMQQQQQRNYIPRFNNNNNHNNYNSNNNQQPNVPGNNSNSNDSSVQTTKSMSWTNSQQKKSTASVSVTATPTAGNNNSNSTNNSSITNNNTNTNTKSANNYSHGSKTYTNQQHQYQQQQHYQSHHQQHHYSQQQQQPQMRNHGAMKTPSSPVATTAPPPGLERKNSQAEQQTSQSQTQPQQQQQQHHQRQTTTSTASTTAVPQQFQQQQQQQVNAAPFTDYTTSVATSYGAMKHPLQQQQHFVNKKTTATTTAAATTGAADQQLAPTINLAPPQPVTSAAASSSNTVSWASLFVSKNSSSSSNSNSNNNGASANVYTNNNTNSSSNNTGAPNFATQSNTGPYANTTKKPVAKVAPYEGVTPVVPGPPLVTPGAMSYSAASAQGIPPAPQVISNASSAGATKKTDSTGAVSAAVANRNLDEWSLKFADFLTKYKTDLTAISLRPRGLTNRSNYCYINSILQALLGCPPFYNLILSIPQQAAQLCEVKTPTVNAMVSYMSNFSWLPSGLRLNNRLNKAGPKSKDNMGGELQCDSAFEPTEIYKLWNESRDEHVEGRQEDAEEFLGYVLNKLNDEMLEVIKLIAKPVAEQNGQDQLSEHEDGDDWQMICNNRNKGSVTRQTDFGRTPLSDIFRGELRSRLQREGEHSTDVIQPFFTLQLNIEKAASVKEALEILVGRDQLEGVTGSKTKQEVVAWQQITLEKLPIVLILHLKWFDYRSDGCTKILKTVEFPVELKIDQKIMASKKYSPKHRVYRLFAVVYHDGKEASKGHYITDVYHTGYSSWLRFDDSSVKPVSEHNVLHPHSPRVPYLLYYRRCDTLPQTAPAGANATPASNASAGSSGK